MPSGFRKFGHLNFINQFSRKHIGRPQHPPTEKVLNFTMTFHDSTKTFFFQNLKIKLNSRTWMTLKSSAVLFQALKSPQPQQPPWHLQPNFTKKNYLSYKWLSHPWHRNDQITVPCVEWIINPNLHWHLNPYRQLLSRPATITLLKTGWWNSNVQTSWTHLTP